LEVNFVKIEVLGMGCCSCSKLYDVVQEAVAELGIEAEVVKVDDMKTVLEKGVMTTPALVVNGVVKVAGRNPGKDEIKKYLR
jgi:small redox-active disulfide protein 2